MIVIGESATELYKMHKITGNESDDEIAKMIVEFQLQKEHEAEECAQKSNGKYVILCDRSVIEPSAYVGIEKVNSLLIEYGTSFEEWRDSYDIVAHLVTVAKGASVLYTTENNDARKEKMSEAVMLDDAIINIWSNHKKRAIFTNEEGGFEKKIQNVVDYIIGNVETI